MYKCDLLPRQARDKHRGNSKTDRFLRAGEGVRAGDRGPTTPARGSNGHSAAASGYQRQVNAAAAAAAAAAAEQPPPQLEPEVSEQALVAKAAHSTANLPYATEEHRYEAWASSTTPHWTAALPTLHAHP